MKLLENTSSWKYGKFPGAGSEDKIRDKNIEFQLKPVQCNGGIRSEYRLRSGLRF